MNKLPQMVYHLRRSHFVNRFGISLDESFFKGYWLSRESVENWFPRSRSDSADNNFEFDESERIILYEVFPDSDGDYESLPPL